MVDLQVSNLENIKLFDNFKCLQVNSIKMRMILFPSVFS